MLWLLLMVTTTAALGLSKLLEDIDALADNVGEALPPALWLLLMVMTTAALGLSKLLEDNDAYGMMEDSRLETSRTCPRLLGWADDGESAVSMGGKKGVAVVDVVLQISFSRSNPTTSVVVATAVGVASDEPETLLRR